MDAPVHHEICYYERYIVKSCFAVHKVSLESKIKSERHYYGNN